MPLRGPLTRYVLAAGWDRRITFYEDNNAKSVGPSRSLAGHKVRWGPGDYQKTLVVPTSNLGKSPSTPPPRHLVLPPTGTSPV